MAVIKGKKAYIEFSPGEESQKFGCLQSFTFQEQIETKSIKTRGDGYKRKFRGQSASATIDLSGLVLYNDSSFTSAFDLAEHCDQMVDIPFAIYFDDEANESVSAIYGTALVINASLGSDVSFARSSFTLQCNEWTIGLPPTCESAIVNYTLTRQGLTFVYHVAILSVTTGTVPQYHWRLDGLEPFRTSFDTGWSFNLATQAQHIHGSHTLEIWPVCENGARGTKLTRQFTVPFG